MQDARVVGDAAMSQSALAACLSADHAVRGQDCQCGRCKALQHEERTLRFSMRGVINEALCAACALALACADTQIASARPVKQITACAVYRCAKHVYISICTSGQGKSFISQNFMCARREAHPG